MPAGVISNPSGAYRQVSDFTTFVDGAGNDLDLEHQVASFRANATITKGDAVMWVAPTTTVPLSVTGLTGNTLAVTLKFAGVALISATAGQVVEIAYGGFARVNVGSATPVAQDLAVRNGSATGAVGVLAQASLDATIIAGHVFGIFLGAQDAGGMAPIWLGRF